MPICPFWAYLAKIWIRSKKKKAREGNTISEFEASHFPLLVNSLQLWQQIKNGVTEPFSSIPGLTGIRATSDKGCNKMRLGGSGEVVEAPCTGNSALVVCGGKFFLFA